MTAEGENRNSCAIPEEGGQLSKNFHILYFSFWVFQVINITSAFPNYISSQVVLIFIVFHVLSHLCQVSFIIIFPHEKNGHK